jgi:ABC-type polar amino acid transport system ATPase subunit
MAKLRRSMGMVFQQFHLFPHMTVAQNIMLAPRKVLGLGLEEASERCIRLLRTMGMETLADRLPSGLSGGQRQRVAIARALAMEPKCMIFDEPTSALDPENIKEVVEAMEQVIAGGVTALIASHDLRLLRRMADVIWFLEDGHLVEITPGERFFERPTTERAEQFLNRLNWMERP